MSRTYTIRANYCHEDADTGAVLGEADLRIHFTVIPGEIEQGPSYACGGTSASGPIVEFAKAEQDVGPNKWEPADRDLSDWAESWLDNHWDEALAEASDQDLADRDDAADARYRERRDERLGL